MSNENCCVGRKAERDKYSGERKKGGRMKRINWDTTKEEMRTIEKIVKRARKMNKEVQFVDLSMDITACHLNGCDLKLDDLLKANDFNFAHDVFGISQHIDRTKGTLKDCFLPRFAA